MSETQIRESVEVKPPRNPKRIAAVSAAVLVLVIAAVVGGVLLLQDDDAGNGSGASPPSGSSGEAGVPYGEATVNLSAATTQVGGAPRGFPHTVRGAVEAAAGVNKALGAAVTWPQTEVEAYFGDVHPGDSAFGQGIATIKQQANLTPDGQLKNASVGERYYTQSLLRYGAYRVVSTAPDKVQVTIWGPDLFGPGAPGDLEQVQVRWSATTYTLEWSDGDWRLPSPQAVSTVDGPAVPENKNRPDVSFEERESLLQDGWRLFRGASEEWPTDLLGREPVS